MFRNWFIGSRDIKQTITRAPSRYTARTFKSIVRMWTSHKLMHIYTNLVHVFNKYRPPQRLISTTTNRIHHDKLFGPAGG